MIKSCDSGSLPFIGDSAKFLEGSKHFGLSNKDDSADYFEKHIVQSFLDKIGVGIEVPNYPQFRDMSEMILSLIDGLEKLKDGYLETKIPSLKTNNGLPEIEVIERNSQFIKEKIGKSLEVRICVTGPYTLASFFPYRDGGTFSRLGNVVSQIIEKSLFSNNKGKTILASVDEPLFGLVDDPLIDFGSEGRENLRKSWETIFSKAKSKNVQTMMHLHSTTNPLFWDIPSLDVIDSHVDDPLIQQKNTQDLLESKDKFLKASVAVNDFDTLIKAKITSDSHEKLTESVINEKIACTWTSIKHGNVNPVIFLESEDTMKNRLVKVINRFGLERVLYVGPECGLKGYPTYENAIECLRRVSSTAQSYRK
jgi:5-methyltetrahydropteroyltriglutamate--homocysteine methyltransferase